MNRANHAGAAAWMLGILAAAAPAAAQLAGPQDLEIPEIPALTVTVDPPEAVEDGVPVQSQILLRIQVASRHAFEALHLDLPEIEGAETVRMQRPRTRKVRSYVGEGHVFETVLGVFPTRSGVLHLPPVRVSGRVQPEPDRDLSFEDASPDRRIAVSGIPPDYGDHWWMASPRVEIEESWSRPPDDLRDGDIVRREVRVTAFGLTADRMAQPEHRRTRWVSVADAGTSSRTKYSATGAIGVVTRAWDLKIEQNGVVYIAPVGISYWHPGERARLRAAVPGRRLEPLPADREARIKALMDEARRAHAGAQAVGAAVGGAASLSLLAALAALLWQLLPTRADRRLARSCASADSPEAVWRAVSAWSEAAALDAAQLPPSVSDLEKGLFGRTAAAVSGADIARDCIRLARRMRLARFGRAPRAFADALLGPPARLRPARKGPDAQTGAGTGRREPAPPAGERAG